MVIELIFVGTFIGAMAGFFGIGGGMMLVPVLLAIGFDIKAAIGISIKTMQMILGQKHSTKGCFLL